MDDAYLKARMTDLREALHNLEEDYFNYTYPMKNATGDWVYDYQVAFMAIREIFDTLRTIK